MAIVKKVASRKIPAPVVKKVEPKYHDHVDDEEYETIEELVEANLCGSSTDHDIRLVDTDLEYTVEELPFCCGIYELGNLQISNAQKSIQNDLTKYLDLLVANTKHKTLMINTNGIDASKFIEESLIKCKNWTAAKKFRNGTGGNTITMWVSNND